jgi:hypothetical protein
MRIKKGNLQKMSQKLKNYLITIAGSLTLLVPVLVPSLVRAQGTNQGVENNITGQACTAVQNANSNTTISLNPTSTDNGAACNDQTAGNTLGSILNTVINIFSIVVGAVSVIMIIVGGFKYITSGGSDQNVESAKNTIIYALVGLVIVVLAQVIVHYVINRISNSSST